MYISWKKLLKTALRACSRVVSSPPSLLITFLKSSLQILLYKNKIFSFHNAVRAATLLKLPNWKKALGRVIAHVHLKAKKYYEDKVIYLRNHKALKEGRLEDVDIDAVRAAKSASWVAYLLGFDDVDTTSAGWNAAEAVMAVGDAEYIAVDADYATYTAARAVDNVDTLIDTYFDVLEEV
jgi:hypothetical protein